MILAHLGDINKTISLKFTRLRQEQLDLDQVVCRAGRVLSTGRDRTETEYCADHGPRRTKSGAGLGGIYLRLR